MKPGNIHLDSAAGTIGLSKTQIAHGISNMPIYKMSKIKNEDKLQECLIKIERGGRREIDNSEGKLLSRFASSFN
jgi:hypothetical protein